MNDRNQDVEESELDQHIRDLLARVIADAPLPPELGEPVPINLTEQRTRRSNPWMISGAALAIAAAAAGAFILPNLGDDNVIDAIETGTTLNTPAQNDPTTTTETGETTTTASPTTTAAPTTTADGANTVTSAGPDGVTLQPLDGDSPMTVGNPARFAVAGPDGRIYYQPADAEGDGARHFEVVDPATGEIDVIDVPNDTTGSVSLQDVAEVDGELTILYVIDPPSCNGGDDPLCVTSLLTYQPDSGRGFPVAGSNGFEFGWRPFALAENGLIFGAGQDSATVSPRFGALGPATPPMLSAIGLEDGYFDCSTCPESFTIDRSGTFVGWLEQTGDQRRIVVTDLATGERGEQPIEGSGVNGFLRIAGIEMAGGEITSGLATFTGVGFEQPTMPSLINLATGDMTALAPGTIATLG